MADSNSIQNAQTPGQAMAAAGRPVRNRKQKKLSPLKAIRRAAWAFTIPGIVIYLIFNWYPILLGLVVGFQKFKLFGNEWVGFANFQQLFNDPLMPRTFVNVLYYTALTIGLTFFVPIIVSILLMEMKPRLQRIMMYLWFIPMAAMASTVLWKYLYNHQYGLLNAILNAVGLPGLGWLNDRRIAMIALVLPGLVMFGPSLIWLATLQAIPQELYEAADMDGAGFITKMFRITIPRLRPMILMFLILGVISSMQVFQQMMVMTGGGPVNATMTPVLYMFNKAFFYMDYGFGAALAIIIFLVIMALTLLQRKFIKGDVDS